MVKYAFGATNNRILLLDALMVTALHTLIQRLIYKMGGEDLAGLIGIVGIVAIVAYLIYCIRKRRMRNWVTEKDGLL